MHRTVDVLIGQAPFEFWSEQSLQFKMQSMCFIMPCFIDLVNKVNTKLLYGDLIQNSSRSAATTISNASSSQEYALLNAFELLWNLDKQSILMNSAQNGGHDSSGGTQQPDLDCQLDSEQMNLVQVLSHQEEQPELKNALSFKSDCVCQLVDICEQIRPGFLKTSAFQTSDRQQVYLDDEVLFVKSIDSKAISSWEDFEFILSVVVENRILKVFVAHQVKLSLEQPIDVCKSDDEETSKKALRKKKSKNKKKQSAAKRPPESSNGGAVLD